MRFEVNTRIRRPNGFLLEAAFDAEAGVLGVSGPSGSGKSTLLDALSGVEPGARVVLDGKDVSREPLHARRIAYLTQDAGLFPHLTVRQNLCYSPRAGDPQEVAEALGISPLMDRMPMNLSGGERRRAALARALLSRPVLLLLDEPFSGLDEARRKEALELLSGIRRRGGPPMVLVSHREEDLLTLADRTLHLDDGRLVPQEGA